MLPWVLLVLLVLVLVLAGWTGEAQPPPQEAAVWELAFLGQEVKPSFVMLWVLVVLLVFVLVVLLVFVMVLAGWTGQAQPHPQAAALWEVPCFD